MSLGLTFRLAVLAAGNLLLNLLFQWYAVTGLGVGAETDALFAGMALPQLLLAVVSGSLTPVLVPLMTAGGGEDGETFRRNARNFFAGVTLFFTAVAVVLFLSADLWIPLLVPGFTAEGQSLTVSLARIQLPGMIFTGSLAVVWAAYHAKQKFVWVELSALLANLLSLLALVWLLPRYGVFAAAWLLTLRTLLQVVCLLPGLGRWRRRRGEVREDGSDEDNSDERAMKIRHSYGRTSGDWWRDFVETWRTAWARLLPLLGGSVFYKTDPLIDRFLTSMSPSGGLSLLYLAQQLYGAAALIINKAVVVPTLPMLARAAGDGDWTAYRRIYRERLLTTTAVTLVAFLVLLAGGELLLRFAIGYANITNQNVRDLWLVMLALSGYFVGGAAGQITSIAFYAKGETRAPTRIGVQAFLLYLPFKALSFIYFGLFGLALSISAYYLFSLAWQVRRLGKDLPARSSSADY